MLDEEKTIDVGEANEQETTIDLDAPAAQESVKEEIHVEEIPADEKPSEAKTDKEELGEYSDGVNKRIAKLTRKMREAERQKEEAITYAKNVTEDANKLRTRFNNLDNNFAKEFEQRVTGSTEAAKQRLAASIAAGDVEAQVEAQSEIATLAMENTRVKRIKQEQEYRANAPAPVQMPQQSTPQPARPDPQADAWASKNSWFGSDNACLLYTSPSPRDS